MTAQMIEAAPWQRMALPNWRPSMTVKARWPQGDNGKAWHVSVAVATVVDAKTGRPAGKRVVEVFAAGGKVGTEIEALIDDACVAISLLLQSGCTATELHRRMGRESVLPGAPHASLLGLIVAVAAELEGEG